MKNRSKARRTTGDMPDRVSVTDRHTYSTGAIIAVLRERILVEGFVARCKGQRPSPEAWHPAR
jgi:hypothetical protein